MRHHIREDWPIGGLSRGVIECHQLYRYISAYKIGSIEISLSRIVANNMDWIEKWNARYKTADLKLPCIVIQDEFSYRLIDGRHRLKKALNKGLKALPCHVLTNQEVLKAYRP